MEEEVPIQVLPGRKSLAGLKRKYGAPRMQQAKQQQRFAQLMTLFVLMDVDKDRQVTLEEMSNHLMQNTNGMFTPDITREIFELIDKNHDQRITQQEFLQSFTEAEELIQTRINHQTEKLNKLKQEHPQGDKATKVTEELEFWTAYLAKVKRQ